MLLVLVILRLEMLFFGVAYVVVGNVELLNHLDGFEGRFLSSFVFE